MRKQLLLLLVLLMTVATNTWAVSYRLYLDVSGTSATLKYGSDFSGKPYYNSGSWSDIGDVKTTVQTITTDATSCANFSGTTLGSLFSQFTALTSVDLSGLNTSKVTNMGTLFIGCSSLTSVDLSSWDTSSATSMGSMFSGCSALTSVNLSSFNTSNVTVMGSMFDSCSSLTTLDLSSFNTSKVYAMPRMFHSCTNLTTIYVGNDWSTAAVTSSSDMFAFCTKLLNYDSGKTDKTNANTGEGGYLKLKAKTYKVTLQEGTEDATNWTVPEEAAEGATVTVTYKGDKKVKSVKAVDPMLATPMTIEAITAGTIQVEHPKEGMQYSKNGGAKTAVTTSIDVAAGDKVQFYGNGTSITKYGDNEMSKCTMIKGSGDGFTCKVYGNIMSLVDEENFATAKTLSDIYTFKFLFYNNTTLTDASRLLLPATKLQESCYMQMFSDCTALAAAPALPAETLAYGCYQQMFASCTALTAAPVLPAKKLVMYCYTTMFNNCEKLATVTSLATSGFNQNECTSNWLNGAGSQAEGTKTFNAVSTANWPSGVNGIPTGWTRVNIDN